MTDIIVELGAGGEVLGVLRDAPTLPPGAVRATADPDMLKRVDSFAYLSVIAGELVLDEAAQAAARQAKAAAAAALRQDQRAREIEVALRGATPQQISDYVDAQVTDLASARTMFKRILMLLALQLRS